MPGSNCAIICYNLSKELKLALQTQNLSGVYYCWELPALLIYKALSSDNSNMDLRLASIC